MNRKRLAEAGILYPTTLDHDDGTEAHHKLGASLRGGAKQNRLSGIAISEFSKILRTSPADIVVISSESLSNRRLQSEKLRDLVRLITGNGFFLTAVVYIRAQPSLANSAYGQGIKAFTFDGSFDDFINIRIAHRSWYVGERLAVWLDQPNIQFIAVPFIPENTGIDIAAKMLKLAGIPPARVDALDLEPAGYVNETPGPLAVAAFRLLANRPEFRDLLDEPSTRNAIREEGERRGWYRDRFVGLDDRRAARIRALFEEDNEAFARRCFDRPWHAIFAADYERHWESNEIDLDMIAPEVKADLDDFLATICAKLSPPNRPTSLPPLPSP
jgi:hypothetical protein